MALSNFAAQAIAEDYLAGRQLPAPAYAQVLRLIEARLVSGQAPVLDRSLCESIDGAAEHSEASSA